LVKIWWQGIKLAVRSRIRFVTFVVVYCALAWLIAINLNAIGSITSGPGGRLTEAQIRLASTLIGSAIVSTLYGFLISIFRKKDIATLKCIGWGNNNVRSLITSEILFVAIIGYILLLEMDIHLLGINAYLSFLVDVSTLILTRNTLILTFIVIVVFQIPGVLIAHWKVLKIRPMEALRAV
jgi:hypothetical protein